MTLISFLKQVFLWPSIVNLKNTKIKLEWETKYHLNFFVEASLSMTFSYEFKNNKNKTFSNEFFILLGLNLIDFFFFFPLGELT